MLSKETVQALEAKHGDILILRGKPGTDGQPKFELAFRRPKRAEYKMFRHNVAKGDPDAQETLAMQMVVSHSREEVDALLDRIPAMLDSCSGQLVKWVGLEEAQEGNV